MFFVLSKLLDLALLPALWLVVLLAWALWSGRRGPLRAALLLTLIGTNNALINEALLAWEVPPVPLAAVAPADAALLLTGVTNAEKSPHDRVYLKRGADRFTHVLWLWRAGRVRRIIISGGHGSLGEPEPGAATEARELRTLLRLAGVPDSAIWLEEKSRNTRENALFAKALLARHPDVRSLVLVTSAFHTRRALGCFRRVGLAPQVFPADFRSTDRRASPDYWLVPDADALGRWSLLLHEVAGWAVYKMLGYC